MAECQDVNLMYNFFCATHPQQIEIVETGLYVGSQVE